MRFFQFHLLLYVGFFISNIDNKFLSKIRIILYSQHIFFLLIRKTHHIIFFIFNLLDPPDVELTLSPSDGIVEEMEENITLTCSLVNGNPDNLTSVNWFLDGELMELEGECSDT